MLSPSAPRHARRSSRAGSRVVDRAAPSPPAGADPPRTARAAADAGAAAVVLHGRPVAPGAIGLDARIGVPVITLPGGDRARAAHRPGRARRARRAAIERRDARPGRAVLVVGARLRRRGQARPGRAGRRAGDVRAGRRAATVARCFGTVSGSSAAAAVVAGAAALLAEARPDADAETLRGLLVGGAAADRRHADRPHRARAPSTSAARRRPSSSPTRRSLAFGRGTREGWRGNAIVRLRNLSSRRLTVYVIGRQASDSGRCRVRASRRERS